MELGFMFCFFVLSVCQGSEMTDFLHLRVCKVKVWKIPPFPQFLTFLEVSGITLPSEQTLEKVSLYHMFSHFFHLTSGVKLSHCLTSKFCFSESEILAKI